MDNNYFDFLGQNSVAGNENTNAGGSNDKGKVNLTVRVDADCQVVCDGDFLFLANANQIVKDKAPMGQHLINFTSLDFPDATVEKIVDFPVEGNNYLIVVNELKEKVEILQKEKEEVTQAKERAEEIERQMIEIELKKERELEIDKAMSLYKTANYKLAVNLFEKNIDYLNNEQHNTYSESLKHCLYSVVLEKYEDKTRVINLIKNRLGLDLNEAMDIVTSVPKIIKKGILRNEAENLKKDFENIGAVVTTEEYEDKGILIVANNVPFQMKYVKGGTYKFRSQWWSCKGEKRCFDWDYKEVAVKDFHIGEYVVTQRLYRAVMREEATYKGGWTDEKGRGDNYPAYRITWFDCKKFIGKLNELTGRHFRLPTAEEWEFAAKGGNLSCHYIYSGSDDADRVCWHKENSGEKIHKVGELEANELGLYDMSGNVFEWCVTKEENEPKRVVRGGCWAEDKINSQVHVDYSYPPDRAAAWIGFRLVLDASKVDK